MTDLHLCKDSWDSDCQSGKKIVRARFVSLNIVLLGWGGRGWKGGVGGGRDKLEGV